MSFPKDSSFKDRVATVKQLIDPAYLVSQLGFTVARETSKELRAACIIHGGDNTTSFRLNKDLKTWVCFTHGCQKAYGNDMFGLVRSVNDCGFMDALDYLEDLTGSKSINKTDLIRFKEQKERKDFINTYGNSTERPSVVDEIKLKYYKPYRSSFFIEDGFSVDTLDFFEIAGGYTDRDGLVRDIIPIRDDKSLLVAYSLRDIRANPINTDQKYKLTPGFDKNTVLYNLHNIKELGAEVPIIIVEGFKSVWRLYSLGIKNVVACMGAGITTGQADLLCSYAHKGVALFYDGDVAGVSAIGRSIDLLEGKLPIYAEIITEVDKQGKGLDPADLTDEQIFYYLESYMRRKTV